MQPERSKQQLSGAWGVFPQSFGCSRGFSAFPAEGDAAWPGLGILGLWDPEWDQQESQLPLFGLRGTLKSEERALGLPEFDLHFLLNFISAFNFI